jgi:hypothetical protein
MFWFGAAEVQITTALIVVLNIREDWERVEFITSRLLKKSPILGCWRPHSVEDVAGFALAARYG